MSQVSLDFFEVVSSALKDNLLTMSGSEPEILSCDVDNAENFASLGFVVIVGITGMLKGRIIFDTSRDTARELSKRINYEDSVDDDLIFNTMGELGNIVSGNVLTAVNNAVKGYKLTLAPPSIFTGDKLMLTSPKIESYKVVSNTTDGKLIVSIGFERGAQ